MQTRAVGYIRVSTEDQARDGVSLEAQRAKIEVYCQFKDLELVEIIEDAGISAKDLRRLGVQRVLEMAKRKRINAVVVFKLDRMFRSTEDALQTTRKFDKWGVSFHSIQETLDTKSAMGRFFFTLTAAFAEMERGIVVERIRVVLAHMKRMGKKTGGDIFMGYDVQDGILVENPWEQKIFQVIKRMRDKRLSLRAICTALEKGGHRTKRGRTYWYLQSVNQILKRVV